MFTQVAVGSQGFVNISAAMVNAAGVRVDPTAANVRVYRVSQTDGSLALEAGIGTGGVVVLAPQDTQVGFWGAGASIVGVAFGQFVVLFTMTFVAGDAVAMDTFVIGPGAQGPTITVTPGVPVERTQ